MTKIIHQIWFQGKESVPDRYQKNIYENQKLNSSWNHYIWKDEDLREACRNFSENALKAYDSCPYMFQKIDLGRYVMLYHHGGMSIDMDARCIKPLDDFLPMIPPSTDIVVSEMSVPTILSRLYGIRFNNAQIYCPKPKSQFLAYVIDECIHRILMLQKENDAISEYEAIQYTTGPVMFFDVYRSAESEGLHILKLPSEYFEPCSLFESSCEPTSETFIIHEMHQSWTSPREKLFAQLARWMNRNRFVFALSVLLGIFIIKFTIQLGIQRYGSPILWFLLTFLTHGIMVIWNDEQFSTKRQQKTKSTHDILHNRFPALSSKQKHRLNSLLRLLCILLVAFVFIKLPPSYGSVFLLMMAWTLLIRGIMVISTFQPRTNIQSCAKMTNRKLFGNACNDKWMSLELVSILIVMLLVSYYSKKHNTKHVLQVGVLTFSVLFGSITPILTRQNYTIDIVITYFWVALLWSKWFSFQSRLTS